MSRYGKCILAAVAMAGLSGCATYDDGYAVRSYGYGYDYGPSYYTYDYGPYYGYSPGYYAGPPAVGFDFRFRDRGRRDFREHRRAERRDGDRRIRQGALRVPSERHDVANAGATRGARLAASPRVQRGGAERPRAGDRTRQSRAPIATARTEQQ
jgi:hypothetical protein